jgi:hypothetical protein
LAFSVFRALLNELFSLDRLRGFDGGNDHFSRCASGGKGAQNVGVNHDCAPRVRHSC